eukprot:CAMPEP_0168537326 /NCGR_PEP_ID=MMETSP0405-20121227/20248_1 /TAXON_ID=498012 /ORGANISM="Trichosphaerium sp, Strain Am-I-7 wt" /LENGTH=348 /DNA_ID=CAMNT_0008565841 /DNA_START=29 /DNA_END=1074 /DNA_ORIENTATION=+
MAETPTQETVDTSALENIKEPPVEKPTPSTEQKEEKDTPEDVSPTPEQTTEATEAKKDQKQEEEPKQEKTGERTVSRIVSGNENTHKVIDRNLERIQKACAQIKKSPNLWPQKRRGALHRHLLTVLDVIETHHGQEEKFIHKALSKRIASFNKDSGVVKDEHEALAAKIKEIRETEIDCNRKEGIDELLEKTTSVRDAFTAFNKDSGVVRDEHEALAAKTKEIRETEIDCNRKEGIDELLEKTTSVRDAFTAHAATETSLVTHELVLKYLPVEEEDVVIKEIMTYAKEQDKVGTQFPMMYYSQTEEERALMFSNLPWFIKNLMLPALSFVRFREFNEFYPYHKNTVKL